MSTNGQLVFTDVDKITFKGVGNTSNAVVDTVTGKIGVGIDSPDANLHVLGNSYVSTNLELGGTLIMGTVNVEAQHSLEAITATGNTTPLTIEFSNATTGIVTTGNVEVGKELTVTGNATVSSNLTVSGNVEVGKELTVTGNATVSSNLTVSGNVEVGTANLFVDTVNSRVGIETDAPDATLHVVGNAYVSSDLIVSSDVRGGYDTNTTSYFGRAAVGYSGHNDAMSISHIDSNDTGGYALLQEANGATMLNSASGQSVHIRQGNVNKMTIHSSGDVGIGAHSPMSLLHLHELDGEGVHRSLLWTSKRSSNQEPKLGYLGTADAAYASGALGLFKNTIISGTENEAVRIQGNGVSWFNGGNVGINKTIPGYILDVHSDDAIHIEQAGNTTFETKIHGGAVFIRNPSTSSGYEHFIINNHATGSHTTSYIQFRRGNTGNGSPTGTISGNGSTISYGGQSDYRVKENIVPMPISGLDTINNLQPKRFNFIGHPDNTYDGFIAHELQEHIPMAVTGVKDEMRDRGNVVKIDDESIIVKEDVSEPDSLEEGTKWVKLSEEPVYQNVDLSKIVTYLVKAVQELSEENQTLKTRLDALENAS